jgi:hypothetical protein
MTHILPPGFKKVAASATADSKTSNSLFMASAKPESPFGGGVGPSFRAPAGIAFLMIWYQFPGCFNSFSRSGIQHELGYPFCPSFLPKVKNDGSVSSSGILY